jgi:hypothetical protein
VEKKIVLSGRRRIVVENFFSDGGGIQSLVVPGVGMPAERERSIEAFDRNNARRQIKLKPMREDYEP